MSSLPKDTPNARSRIQELGSDILADVDTTLKSIVGPDDPDLLSQLDADISYLEQYIAVQMRRRRNSRVSFLCLPPEIIGRVALSLAEDWPPCMPDGKPLHIGWLNLTHVCNTLRSLVLSHRQLWANDAFTVPNIDFCSMMISRAVDYPLSTNLLDRDGMEYPQSLTGLLWEHLPSIRTVHIVQERISKRFSTGNLVNPRMGLWPFACNELSKLDLPVLRYMSISIARSARFSLTYPDCYTCPHMLAPNLRYLSLENAHVPFDSSTLTELSLSTGKDYTPSPDWVPPPAYFLDTLKNGVNLRVLKLRATIPNLDEHLQTTAISFPHLKLLSMQDKMHKCLRLWSLLEIPPHTKIRLHLLYDDRVEASSVDVMEQLSCLATVTQAVTGAFLYQGYVLRLSLFMPFPDGCDPSQYSSKGFPAIFKGDSLRFELEIMGLSSAKLFASTTVSKCAAVFGLDSVHNLYIENERNYDAKEWRSMLAPFKGIQTMEISTWEEKGGYGQKSTSVDHMGVIQALLNSLDDVLRVPLLRDLRLQAVVVSTSCDTESLLSIAQSRGLQRIRIRLLVFDEEYDLCDAERWVEERQAFMERMEALGTSTEGFKTEQERVSPAAEDAKQREARERVLIWQERLAAARR